jgi:hypothetical protein
MENDSYDAKMQELEGSQGDIVPQEISSDEQEIAMGDYSDGEDPNDPNSNSQRSKSPIGGRLMQEPAIN